MYNFEMNSVQVSVFCVLILLIFIKINFKWIKQKFIRLLLVHPALEVKLNFLNNCNYDV